MIPIPAFPDPISLALLGLPALPMVAFGIILLLEAPSGEDRVIPAGMVVYGLLMCWAMASLLVAS